MLLALNDIDKEISIYANMLGNAVTREKNDRDTPTLRPGDHFLPTTYTTPYRTSRQDHPETPLVMPDLPPSITTLKSSSSCDKLAQRMKSILADKAVTPKHQLKPRLQPQSASQPLDQSPVIDVDIEFDHELRLIMSQYDVPQVSGSRSAPSPSPRSSVEHRKAPPKTVDVDQDEFDNDELDLMLSQMPIPAATAIVHPNIMKPLQNIRKQ
jgi:hypothetical protein